MLNFDSDDDVDVKADVEWEQSIELLVIFGYSFHDQFNFSVLDKIRTRNILTDLPSLQSL